MSKCYPRQQAVRETEVTHKEAGHLVGEKQSASDLPFTNTHQKKTKEIMQTKNILHKNSSWNCNFYPPGAYLPYT